MLFLFPLVSGILVVVLGCVFNPAFVKRYISSDHHLESGTATRIALLEAFVILVGLALILFARFIRVYTPKKEKAISNFLIICFSTGFTLILVEIGLKVLDLPRNRPRHAFFQYDATLGWTHQPKKDAFFKDVRVQINANGLRDTDITYQKPNGEFRILFLGDSQLFGDGVSAEETFASLLERKLNAAQAINAGIIGYGTDQQLLFLKKDGVKYAPDLIVVTLNAYDFQDNVSETIRSGYAKPVFKIEGGNLSLTNVPVPNFDIVERLDRRLRNMSHLYYFMGSHLESFMNRGANEGKHTYDPGAILLKPVQLESSVTITQRILKEIAQVGQTVNAKTIVVFLPYEMDFGSDLNYRRQIDHISHALDKYSQGNGFLFLDIRAELAKVQQTPLYQDTMHFNREGHKVAAQVLERRFIELDVIPKVHQVGGHENH